MKHRTCAIALSMVSVTALADGNPAMTPKEEARALIGMEYIGSFPGTPIAPGKLSCIYEGGGMLQINGVSFDDWAYGKARCQGHPIVFLERAVGKVGDLDIWRAIDTLVLPPHEVDPDPRRLNALRLLQEGDCELNGRVDTDFIALVRWGRHEEINWRTGVEKAWTFDIERGRIVPLSTKRIVCHRPEPA